MTTTSKPDLELLICGIRSLAENAARWAADAAIEGVRHRDNDGRHPRPETNEEIVREAVSTAVDSAMQHIAPNVLEDLGEYDEIRRLLEADATESKEHDAEQAQRWPFSTPALRIGR